MSEEIFIRWALFRGDVARNKKYIFIGIAILCFVLYLMFPPIKATKMLRGELVGLNTVDARGPSFYLRVKLENGNEVLVRVPHVRGFYNLGAAVEVKEFKNIIFGNTSYEFEKFIIENET